MSDRLSRLQALLDEPPSVAVFEQILALLDQWHDSELEAGLARAEAGLRSWPDELRWAGEQLLGEAPDGTFSRIKPIARLVRKLEFEPSEAGCDSALVQLIARAPELGNLTILNLLCEDVDDDGAAAIVNSPTLARLKELRLGDKISDFGLCAIARSPYLEELEQLELRGWISDDETAEILANSPHMAKLADLQLDDDGLGTDGYRALAMSKYIPAEIRAYYLEA
jgi:predicted transcriptional regulator